MKTIEQLGDLQGRRVVVRSDLNVPLASGADSAPQITDDGRIRASIPTIRTLTSAGAKVVVLAHLGRPQGKPDPTMSLRPVAHRLSELLEQPVGFSSQTVGPTAEAVVNELQPGQVAVMENVRFNAAETSSDDAERGSFADQLARLGDCFVSDGFGVVHRAHASVYDIAQRLPAAMGELVAAEVAILEQLTTSPQRPYAVVLGGAKVSDKLAVIDNLLTKADTIVVGGGMVFTFLAALGHSVGSSLLEEDQIDTCRGYLQQAQERGVELVLPTDVVVAPEFAAEAPATVVPIDQMPAGQMGLDIGPASAERFADIIAQAQTVFWNGPMGVFEFSAFAEGTRAVARGLTEVKGLSVVGGGDSAAAIRQLGFNDNEFGHISTGGGASLEYLEGKQLPGLSVLSC